jgi:hypothetical protein
LGGLDVGRWTAEALPTGLLVPPPAATATDGVVTAALTPGAVTQ